jgi:hypothetical protein
VSTPDDWAALGETWRRSPPVDLTALRRKVDGKRRRMALMVSLELALTAAASVLIVRTALYASTGTRAAWAWTMLAFVWLFQLVLLHARRRQWRPPTLAAADLLALIKSRARAAIRLAWLNIAGIVVAFLLSLPFAIDEWANGQLSTKRLIALAAFTCVSSAAFVTFCGWYVRRQRRRIAVADALLRDLTE